MTISKARREFAWMLDETRAAETMLRQNRRLLGDACRELRKAHGLSCDDVALVFDVDVMELAEIERSASTSQARQYRTAIRRIGRKP